MFDSKFLMKRKKIEFLKFLKKTGAISWSHDISPPHLCLHKTKSFSVPRSSPFGRLGHLFSNGSYRVCKGFEQA